MRVEVDHDSWFSFDSREVARDFALVQKNTFACERLDWENLFSWSEIYAA